MSTTFSVSCQGEQTSRLHLLYVLDSLLSTRLLQTYQELRSPAALRTLERARSTATLVMAVPVIFPSSYPFSFLATSSVNSTSSDPVPLFNCALAEVSVVIFALILASPREMLVNSLETIIEFEGQDGMTKFLMSFFAVATSALRNEAYPEFWLNVNVLAHRMLLKMMEPVAYILVREYIPEQRSSQNFNPTLWHDAFYMLLKLLSSDLLAIEEFNSQVSSIGVIIEACLC